MKGTGRLGGCAILRDWSGIAAKVSFLLLVCVYSAFAVRFAPANPVADEGGYLFFARNILQGFYSPHTEVNLWWGPGYPLLLAAAMRMDPSLVAARILNALFMAGSVGLVFVVLRRYLSMKLSVLGAAYTALTVPVVEDIRFLSSGPLAFFLVSAWAYASCRMHGARSQARWTVLASVALAYLALTKVLFGYVIAAGLLVTLALVVARIGVCRRWIVMYTLSLVFCLPYLTYTFDLTGKVFYWGNSGGLSLYWMATPYASELGDWQPPTDAQRMALLAPEHSAFFASISTLPTVAQDDALRAKATSWILQHPLKYVQNWAANLGRMVMNYPYSYTPFKPASSLALLVLNVPAIAMTLFGMRLVLNRRTRRAEFLGVTMFLAIALAGSSLLSAYPRQFSVLLPLMLLVGAMAVWLRHGKLPAGSVRSQQTSADLSRPHQTSSPIWATVTNALVGVRAARPTVHRGVPPE